YEALSDCRLDQFLDSPRNPQAHRDMGLLAARVIRSADHHDARPVRAAPALEISQMVRPRIARREALICEWLSPTHQMIRARDNIESANVPRAEQFASALQVSIFTETHMSCLCVRSVFESGSSSKGLN